MSDDEIRTSEFGFTDDGDGLHLIPLRSDADADAPAVWEDVRKIAAAEIAAGEVDKARRVGEHLTQYEAELIAEREMRRLEQEHRQRGLAAGMRSVWPET